MNTEPHSPTPNLPSRRNVLGGAALGAAGLAAHLQTGAAQADVMAVQDVIDTILAQVPNARTKQTVDTLKSGDPETRVTGIVTTFLATLEVLRRARELGANMVITHEPTYYQGQDNTEKLEGDAVLEYKRGFIEDSGIAIWRFHDNWHLHQPDGILTGVAKRMGWEGLNSAEQPRRYVIPQTTVRDLARAVKEKMRARVVRIVGDPEMSCTQVALVVGAPGSERQIQALQAKNIDVLIGGESREWETVEYARDAAAAGMRKALILAGHANSEEPGMDYMAEWLQPLVGNIPVTFVPASDPFWSV